MHARTTTRQDALARWLDVHGTSDLSRAERVRLCGESDDDSLITYCEAQGIDYSLRTVPAPYGQRARIGVVVSGAAVARRLGNWGWSDDYGTWRDLTAGARVASV